MIERPKAQVIELNAVHVEPLKRILAEERERLRRWIIELEYIVQCGGPGENTLAMAKQHDQEAELILHALDVAEEKDVV